MNERSPKKPVLADRLPPHSPEAERGCLGCLMSDPQAGFPEVIRQLGGFDAVVFYDLRHQAIFGTLVGMYEAQEPIDLITLQQKLREQRQLEAVGGLTYLNQLLDEIPSASNLGYYLDAVAENYKARRLLQICTGVVSRVYEGGGSGEEVNAALEALESETLKLREGVKAAEFVTGKEIANRAIDEIERAHSGVKTGIFSGISDLDKATGGWRPGEVVVIAALPGTGKTAIALNIAAHNAIEKNIPVGIFSMEMQAVTLGIRIICGLADVDTKNIRDGFLAERDFPRLSLAASRIAQAPLVVDEHGDMDIRTLRARARRMVHDHKVQLIVVDYIQLIAGVSRKASENRQVEVAEVSTSIKSMAKELNIPVIVLAQLNRESEKRGGKPRLSDLKESGRIGEDASFVGVLYRTTEDEAERENEDIQKICPVSMFIPKQREGDSGFDVRMMFNKRFQRFHGAVKITEEDVPR